MIDFLPTIQLFRLITKTEWRRLSQNVKTHSDSPRFREKINKKKNRRQNLTVERTAKQRSVKNRPLLLYILLNFTKLSNHFFK